MTGFFVSVLKAKKRKRFTVWSQKKRKAFMLWSKKKPSVFCLQNGAYKNACFVDKTVLTKNVRFCK